MTSWPAFIILKNSHNGSTSLFGRQEESFSALCSLSAFCSVSTLCSVFVLRSVSTFRSISALRSVSALRSISALRSVSALRSPLSIMPPAHQKRLAIRHPAPGPISPGPEPAPALAPTTNNDLFQEFMRTCIEKVRDQAPAAPAALAALAASTEEVRDDTDMPLKLRNSNLYYGHLHIECFTSVSNTKTISRLQNH